MTLVGSMVGGVVLIAILASSQHAKQAAAAKRPTAIAQVEPKVEPQVEPKVEPQVEPKVEPQVEPKTMKAKEIVVAELKAGPDEEKAKELPPGPKDPTTPVTELGPDRILNGGEGYLLKGAWRQRRKDGTEVGLTITSLEYREWNGNSRLFVVSEPDAKGSFRFGVGHRWAAFFFVDRQTTVEWAYLDTPGSTHKGQIRIKGGKLVFPGIPGEFEFVAAEPDRELVACFGIMKSAVDVSFHPDGRTLAVTMKGVDAVALLDAFTGKRKGHLLQARRNERPFRNVLFCPDGTAVGTFEEHGWPKDGGITLWGKDGKPVKVSKMLKQAWQTGTLSSYGNLVAQSFGYNVQFNTGAPSLTNLYFSLVLWDMSTGKHHRLVFPAAKDQTGGGLIPKVECLAFHPKDPNLIAAGGLLTTAGLRKAGRPPYILPVIGGSPLIEEVQKGYAYARVIALLNLSTKEEVSKPAALPEWKVPSPTRIFPLDPTDVRPGSSTRVVYLSRPDRAAPPFPLAFTPDGKVLVAGLWKKVKLWDVSTGKLLGILDGPTDMVTSLAFTSDGRLLVIGGADNRVEVWDTSKWKRIARFAGNPDNYTVNDTVRRLVFSPDDKILAIVTEKGFLKESGLALREVKDVLEKGMDSLSPVFVNSLGMRFALVPKGRAWLGGGDNKFGDKKVEIAQDFYLGSHEVTQAEWERVMGTNPSWFSRTGTGKDAVSRIDIRYLPVENISWEDAQRFLKRLNEFDQEPGWTYRLPKEVEWEYACRGGPMADEHSSKYHFCFNSPTNLSIQDFNGRGNTIVHMNAGNVNSLERFAFASPTIRL
jgi:WD40 repeat protein